MSVIIRLQNLPWTANAMDIRQLFQGLSIPDGGVHIVGGDNGDAFIAFSSDEDARKAMHLDGALLLQHHVKLYLSSKSEMQTVISVARGQPGSQGQMADPYNNSQPYSSPAAGVPHTGPEGGNFMAPATADLTAGYQMGSDRNMANNQGLQSFGLPGNLGFKDGGLQAPKLALLDSPHLGEVRQTSVHDFGSLGARPLDTERPQHPPRDGVLGREPYMGRDREPPMDMPFRGNEGNLGASAMGQSNRQERSTWDRATAEFLEKSTSKASSSRGGRHEHEEEKLSDRRYRYEREEDTHFSSSKEEDYGTRYVHVGRGQPLGSRAERGPLLEAPGRITSRSEAPQDQFSRDDRMLKGPRESYFEPKPVHRDERDRDTMVNRPSLLGNPEPVVYGRDTDFDVTLDREIGLQDQGHFEDKPYRDEKAFGHQGFQDDTGFMETDPYREPRMERRMVMNDEAGHRDRERDYDDRQSNFDRRNFARGDGMDNVQNERSFNKERMVTGPVRRYDRDRSPLRRDPPMSHEHVMDPERTVVDTGRSRYERFEEEYNFVDEGMHRSNSRGRNEPTYSDAVGGTDVFLYVSNMPTSVNYRDVRQFFRGSHIPNNGLKLINDETGVRNGTAFIMFSSAKSARDALERNGAYFMNQRLYIERASAEDFQEALDSYVPKRRPNRDSSDRQRHSTPLQRQSYLPQENCVEVKNIPYRTKQSEIKDYFSRIRVTVRGGIVMETNNLGRFNGIILMECDRTRDFEEVLAMHKAKFNGREIEITSIEKQEFEERVKFERGKGKTDKEKEVKEPPKEKERGQEQKVEKEKEKSHETGRQKENEREKTKEADGKSKHSPRDDKSNISTEKGRETAADSAKDTKEKFYCVRMHGLPFFASTEMVTEFFAGLEIAHKGVHLLFKKPNQAAAVAFAEFVSTGDCEKAQDKNKQYIGKRLITIKQIKKKDMLDEIQSLQMRFRNYRDAGLRGRGRGTRSFSRGRGGHDFAPRGDMHGDRGHFQSARSEFDQYHDTEYVDTHYEQDELRYEDDMYQGARHVHESSTVSMFNVHYRAQAQDLLDFFAGFHVDEWSVIIHTNPEGAPVGEASATFETPDDAHWAIRELSGRRLLGRPVEIIMSQ